MEEKVTVLEKVSLSFTDLTGDKTGCTAQGSNKFWTGWVEELPDGTHNFECRWGPTGTPGNDRGSKRGISQTAAFRLLESKTNSKLKKGYTKLDTRSIAEETAKAAAKGVDLVKGDEDKVVAAPASTPVIHPEVNRLLGIIYNETSRVVRSGLSAQAGATEDNPLGNLSDRQLDVGGGILDKIAELLEKRFGHETTDNAGRELALRKDGVPTKVIIDLTNEYMSNVPRSIGRSMRGRENLHLLVISSYERLEEQRKFLQLLRDAHLAQATFQAAATTPKTNKEVVWYDGLGCTIEFCDPSSADHGRVAEIFDTKQSQHNGNWFQGGSSILKLARVWKFTRNKTTDLFDSYAEEMKKKPKAVGNIFTWHGTRTENLLGIGKSGLLMPENLPRGIRTAGKAFGRGIYHAPAWNATGHDKIGKYKTDGTNGALKSMNYTSARGAYYGGGNTSSSGFMFLQEVALGNGEVRTTACWDKKRPDKWPQHDFIYASAGECASLVHDEIVTFDEKAQVFRYLVETNLR